MNYFAPLGIAQQSGRKGLMLAEERREEGELKCVTNKFKQNKMT